VNRVCFVWAATSGCDTVHSHQRERLVSEALANDVLAIDVRQRGT
jgi:hypothetical protein